MILLEVITGRQIYDQTEIHELKVEVLILDLKIIRTSTNLFPYCIQTWQSPDFFCFFFQKLEMSLAESSELRDITDPSIRGTFAYDSLKTIAQITLNCLNEESSQRPSIEDILWHMQYSVQVQEGWTSSGNLSAKF